jgi:hypothetical protein
MSEGATPEERDTGVGPVPSRPLAGALGLLAVQAVLTAATVGTAGRTVPPVAAGGLVGTSVVAALLVGRDARAVADRAGPDGWTPNPLVWGGLMLPFGLNLGVCAGYATRRSLGAGSAERSRVWLRLLVVAGTAASLTAAVVLQARRRGAITGAVGPLTAVALVGLGLTAVAVFYDTRYVAGRLSDAGERWPLDGYHWVGLILLTVPGNLLFILGYALRRRGLLGSLGDDSRQT